MLWIVLGWEASFSGGGVTMAAVFSFLDGGSVGALCCFRLAFDLAILMGTDCGVGGVDGCTESGENIFGSSDVVGWAKKTL